MIELLINNELISGVDEVRLTKAVNDLGDLPSRQGEYSVTIDVPLTKSNCMALANVEQVNNVTKLYNQINSYELYESGVLVSNGTARILSVKDTIQVVLLSNNSDWLGLIGDKSLRLLDVSENDYTINIPTIEPIRLQTSKMCCPNIYYGGFVDPSSTFHPADLKPCFYVNYLVEKIFNEAGFSLINNMSVASRAIYDKIITVPTSKWLQVSYNGISYKGTFCYSDNVGVGYVDDYLYIGGDKHYCGSGFPKGYPTLSKYASPSNIPQEVITISTQIRKPRKIKGYIEFQTTTNQAGPCNVSLTLNCTTSVGMFFIDLVNDVFQNAGVYRYDYDKDISLSDFTPSGIGAEPAAEMEADLQFYTSWSALFLAGSYKILGGEITIYDDGFENSTQNLQFGYDLVADTAGCLPDLAQTDLLATVVNQFCLLLSTNTLTKEVTIVELQTVIDNIPNAKDWSEHVDLSEPHEIIYDFFDKYFQRNWFKYKEDEKDLNIFGNGLGNYYVDFDNENLPQVGDIFESKFSPIQRILFPAAGLNPDLTLATSPYYPDKDLNPKLAVTRITTNNILTMSNAFTPTQSNEVFFDPIAFVNLISLNYDVLNRILKNNTVIKMLFRLTRSDFANFDFSTPIFIDVQTDKGQVRGHFYVNNINQYNVGANDSCEVTLIQID